MNIRRALFTSDTRCGSDKWQKHTERRISGSDFRRLLNLPVEADAAFAPAASRTSRPTLQIMTQTFLCFLAIHLSQLFSISSHFASRCLNTSMGTRSELQKQRMSKQSGDNGPRCKTVCMEGGRVRGTRLKMQTESFLPGLHRKQPRTKHKAAKTSEQEDEGLSPMSGSTSYTSISVLCREAPISCPTAANERQTGTFPHS